MNKIILLLILTGWGCSVNGQQEAIFSQFMFQKTVINPGAVGSAGHPCFTLIHRKQWQGIEGSPSTQDFNFQTPLSAERVGLGINLMNDRIGYFNTTSLSLQYAYRIDTEHGGLGLGLQGTMKRFHADYAEARTIQEVDPNVGLAESFSIFNVGFGAYFQAEKWYVGASIPNYLEKGLRKNNNGLVDDFSGETPHAYLMGGFVFDLNRKVKMRPAVLLKKAKHSPLNVDLNLSFGFQEKLWAGLTYRFSNSKVQGAGGLDFILNYQITERLRAGAAYGIVFSDLQKKSAGTYEIMLGYCLRRDGKGVRNPRFF